MPRPGAIEVDGIVMEAFPNRTYRVALANGHQLTGFVAGGGARRENVSLAPGEKVRLELSPCDLSQGRIKVEEH